MSGLLFLRRQNMASLSDYLESGILTHVFASGTFAKPSNLSVALCSGVPRDNDTGATIPELPSGVDQGNVATSTGYARVSLGAPNVSPPTWNDVGYDISTTYAVFHPAVEVHESGYYYPLYLNSGVAQSNTSTTVSLRTFSEFPGVEFFSADSAYQSGQNTDPGFTLYQGNGFIRNRNSIVFSTALTDWGSVSGVAIVDASGYGAGNLLMYSQLTNPRIVYTGDNIKFDVNSLEISFR
jgi:hypothetical protein